MKLFKLGGIALALFMLVSLVAVGIGHAQQVAQTAVEQPPVQIAGIWRGQWSWGGYDGTIEMKLTQNGEEIAGTYDFHGGIRRLYNEPVRGTLKGNALSLTIQAAPFSSITATVQDGEMSSGTYIGFTGAHVSFTATKK